MYITWTNWQASNASKTLTGDVSRDLRYIIIRVSFFTFSAGVLSDSYKGGV